MKCQSGGYNLVLHTSNRTDSSHLVGRLVRLALEAMIESERERERKRELVPLNEAPQRVYPVSHEVPVVAGAWDCVVDVDAVLAVDGACQNYSGRVGLD